MKNKKSFSIKNSNSTLITKAKKHKLLFFGVILLIFILPALFIYLGSNRFKTSSVSYENETQKQFSQYTSGLFYDQLTSDSLSMHFYILHPESLGLDNAAQSLGDYTYDSMIESQNYYIDEIRNLESFDYNQLTQDQQITYDILIGYFRNQLDFSDLCLCSQILSPTTGLQAQLPILFSEYQFTCKNDVDNYLTLLSQVKDYYTQICEFQKLKAENDSFISDFSCDGIVDQCSEFLGDGTAENNLLYSSFNERINAVTFLTDAEKTDYISQNKAAIEQSVIPAYQSLIQTLSDLKSQGYCKNPNGLYYLKNGQDYYEFLTKTYTGSSQTVMELKADIQANLVDDIRTMYSILTISPELEEQFYGDSRTTASPQEILEDLNQKASNDFPLSEDMNYEIKYVDESLENYLSPAFYLSPPIDAPDNNVIYINGGSNFSGQDIYTTLAHEGIPGHMFQASYFSATNPDPVRFLINYGGYTEGWATYVEFISYSYEYADPQLAQALSCSASYSLALYSLCDIGINYEGWTLDDTKEFLANYNLDDESVCENIFQAVIEEPANYLQYYVGYIEICNIKEEMQEKLGDKFNLKNFHEALLSLGPCDFATARKWIFQKYAQLKEN